MTRDLTRKILTLLFFGVLMGALDIAIIGPALPTIKEAFSVDDRVLPWVLNIYILMNLMGTPLLGKLSDLYGRKHIYIFALLLFGVGSAVVMLSTSFTQVLIGRAIQGFGAGGIFPVAAAVIGDVFPKEKQGSALGLIGAVFGLAFIIGPVLGGVLLLVSWHLIFAINIPVAIILAFYAFRLLPGRQKSGPLVFDLQGAMLLMFILGAFSFGVNHLDVEHPFRQWFLWNRGPMILGAFCAIPLFLWLQKKHPEPIVNLDLLKNRQLILIYMTGMVAGIGEVGVMFIPSLAKASFGVSESTGSFMLMPLVVALMLGAPLAGRLTDRLGPKPVLIAGAVILVSGFLIIELNAMQKSIFYSSTILIGLGLSVLLGAPPRYIVNRETKNITRASGQSIMTVFTSTGQLVSAALAGALIAGFGGGAPGYHAAFTVFGLISVLAIITSSGIKNNK